MRNVHIEILSLFRFWDYFFGTWNRISCHFMTEWVNKLYYSSAIKQWLWWMSRVRFNFTIHSINSFYLWSDWVFLFRSPQITFISYFVLSAEGNRCFSDMQIDFDFYHLNIVISFCSLCASIWKNKNNLIYGCLRLISEMICFRMSLTYIQVRFPFEVWLLPWIFYWIAKISKRE